ncbi:D-alanyl-D-alanine carboxypeptidase [Streptomyces sp. HM190]|uniref:D-alanyl-D-alanine carboxypeptidase n=1 Tax=Streptomyces sp. HM190 TaxID=2695266 RepID=UPI00135A035C|nr:D-alanyl-D-alanine carboxypeptidase [Streptomyces sp. HM190]
MAGTSPDRSKRYESSTSSASGSEPPIPEASGSSSPDPRLSLSRPTSPSPAQKPDQATAVFSRRDLLETTEGAEREADAEGATADAGPGAGGAAGTAGGAGSDDPGRDETTAADADADADADAEREGEGEGGDDGAEAEVSLEEPAEAVPAAETEAGTGDAADAGSESESGAASRRSPGTATPTLALATRLPAAREAEGAGDETGADVPRDAEPDEAVAGADQVTGGREDADAETEGAASRDGGSGAADGERGGSGPVGDAEPEAGYEGAGDARTGEENGEGSEGSAKAGSGTPAPKGGSGVFFAKSRPSAAEAKPEAGAEPETKAEAGAEPETKPEAEPKAETKAEAEPPVDQATAVFRAPRVPAVDQPTTMLKLGAAAPRPAGDGTDDTDAPSRDAERDATATPGREGAARDEDAKATPEDAKSAPDDARAAPSERTSKFVALKSLDDPAPSRSAQPSVAPAEATRTVPQVGPERTTQQPLPPKPPLDLLAELTNTPPPPQTPLRTAVRRIKIWTPLVILLVIVFAVVQNFRSLPAPTLALTAKDSYAFDGDKVTLPWPEEGQGWMDVNGIGTLDRFGEQKPVAIGSVAKAMTAYVILKEHPMKPGAKGATIPVDAKAETEGGYDKDGESTLNTVKEGDKLSQYDAIAAIMIPSANNIARLLARWDSNGSEAEFVKKMNAAAKDLGMKNTTYTDPSGLKETTVSTAEDQVKLGNELVRMKALTDITKLPYWHDPTGKRWDNYNRLVPYNNAIGIKTGSTSAAGGNLLFAATQEVGGETAVVVGAILGQHTPPIIDTVNAVSKTAMLAAQDALTSDTVLKKGDVVGYVDDRLGGQTPVVVTEDVSAVGWAGKTVKLGLEPAETIPHQAKAGTKVGSLTVGDGTGYGVEVPVALQKDLTEPGFVPKLTRVS